MKAETYLRAMWLPTPAEVMDRIQAFELANWAPILKATVGVVVVLAIFLASGIIGSDDWR